jgi:hypothetical protein
MTWSTFLRLSTGSINQAAFFSTSSGLIGFLRTAAAVAHVLVQYLAILEYNFNLSLKARTRSLHRLVANELHFLLQGQHPRVLETLVIMRRFESAF